MERPRFNVFDYIVSGNINFLFRAVKNKNTLYFLDADGIAINSPQVVCEDFTNKTKIVADPKLINEWNFLTNLAIANNLSATEIFGAEDGWFNAKVLGGSPRYLFMRPLVRLLINHVGPERVFVLTARRENLQKVTRTSYDYHYPMIQAENIIFDENKPRAIDLIMRQFNDGGQPVLMEDSFKNVKEVHSQIPNSLLIYVPLGLVQPEFYDERIIQFKRYPVECQGQRPLYEAFRQCVAQY